MNTPEGFAFTVIGEEVQITHRGRQATTLRARAATEFLAGIQHGDPQELMARATGNYKRGNERQAKNHPRNH